MLVAQISTAPLPSIAAGRGAAGRCLLYWRAAGALSPGDRLQGAGSCQGLRTDIVILILPVSRSTRSPDAGARADYQGSCPVDETLLVVMAAGQDVVNAAKTFNETGTTASS